MNGLLLFYRVVSTLTTKFFNFNEATVNQRGNAPAAALEDHGVGDGVKPAAEEDVFHLERPILKAFS